MGTENKVYQQMLKNESGAVVFGYTGSYNHGSIDTLPEWKAKDKEVTKYINSLSDQKRISSLDKKQANFYLEGGYGLTAEALTSERARKIANNSSVEAGFQAQLPFQHSEFKTAGDMFDAATQKQMSEDLSAHISNEQSNKVVFNADDKVVNFSLDAMGTDNIVPSLTGDKLGVLSDIQTIPIPAIPAEDGYLQTVDLGETKVPGFFHQDSSDPFFTNETFIPSAFDGTEATAIEAYKLEAAADAGRNFLKESFTYVPQPEITSFDELKAPHFGVTNPMISTPGTPNGLAAAIDADDALNDKLQAEYLVSKQVDKMLDEAEDKAAETQKKLTFEAERAAEAALAAEVAANNKRIRFEEAKKEAKRNADDLMDQMAEDTAKKIEAERLQALQLANDKYVGDSQYLGQDPIQVELIKEAKLERERILALQENAHLVADEKLIETARKIGEEKEQANVDDEQGFLADKIATEKAGKEQSLKQKLETTNQSVGAGVDARANAKRLAKKKAEEERKNELAGPNFVSDGSRRRGSRGLVMKSKDPFAFSTLQYPPNVTNSQENGHYILFYVNVQNKTKYDYQSGRDASVRVGDYAERVKEHQGKDNDSMFTTFVESNLGARESGFADEVAYSQQLLANGAPGNVLWNNMSYLTKNRKPNASGISQALGPTTTRITDSVALYLPPAIKSDLSAQYDDSKTGMFGFLALSGKGLLKAMDDHDFDSATDTVFDVAGTLLGEAGKKFAAAAVSAVTGAEGVQATFDKAFGQTLNPYIEVTFGSMGMRTFDYTFKFSPKSKKETEEAKAIIQLFRFHMAPELKNDSSPHRYMTLPSTFDIHYMYQSGVGNNATARENDYYNKIATCVLTNVGVDYTPNSEIQSFADGAPTQMSLALSFKETEMMTKQKINDGF